MRRPRRIDSDGFKAAISDLVYFATYLVTWPRISPPLFASVCTLRHHFPASNSLTKFCRERAPAVTDLPFDRIAQATQPTSAQRSALEGLKNVSAKSAEGLKANCPIYAAVTPTGRIEAMEKRLEATHSAVTTVQPALTKFYDGLSDEQKARFNSLRADAAGTNPPPAPVVVDQGHSRIGERGNSVSSSRNVTPPQYLDEE